MKKVKGRTNSITASSNDAKYYKTFRELANDCGKAADILDDLISEMDDINQEYETISDYLSSSEIDAMYTVADALRLAQRSITYDVRKE